MCQLFGAEIASEVKTMNWGVAVMVSCSTKGWWEIDHSKVEVDIK